MRAYLKTHIQVEKVLDLSIKQLMDLEWILSGEQKLDMKQLKPDTLSLTPEP